MADNIVAGTTKSSAGNRDMRHFSTAVDTFDFKILLSRLAANGRIIVHKKYRLRGL